MTSGLPATGASSTSVPIAQDFYELRREGIGHIAEMGSDTWTDYNTHDPGITILEAVSYAMTELAYRTGLPIADILSSAASSAGPATPYADQPFFPARRILTVNPTTPDDFRRLLIDLPDVRNAWLHCRTCACDVVVYAWCEHDRLTLSYDPSARDFPETPVVRVQPRGLYDVALELEGDAALGDLNDRKLVARRAAHDQDGRPHPVTLEVRFPDWPLTARSGRELLLHGADIDRVAVSEPVRSTTDPVPVDAATLRRHWRDVFYVSFEIRLTSGDTVTIEHASLRLFGDGPARDLGTKEFLAEILADPGPTGFARRYREKLRAIDRAIAGAKAALEAHRNLDEDWCHVRGIDVEDVAVCADVEVRPDADIELVQATIWFEIEQYLTPPIPFRFLDELLAAGTPVEAIFNGPEMDSGFLAPDDLARAGLLRVVRASDVLDRLMEIPGVLGVRNLRFTAYDGAGLPIAGAADPEWNEDGSPRFDPGRTTASWLLFVSAGHQPRLYRNLSRFLFTSDGLPFVPRMDEAEDTLTELHGKVARPKLRAAPADLPVPAGARRQLDAYFPVQHSFPLTYGIGPAGLPSTATTLRRAQAKQLKAYLLVFDQILRNAYAQLAHTADLFSLAPQEHTYFTAAFTPAEIDGYTQLVHGLDAATLAGLVESETEFAERRNRFLDHVLARFGEQFGEYAMLLTGRRGSRAARKELIDDKIAFLRAYPGISHDRGRAFNRVVAPCSPANASGLEQRISLLLGYPDLSLVWRAESGGAGFSQSLTLRGRDDVPLLTFPPPGGLAPALQALLDDRNLSDRVWTIVFRDGRLQLTIGPANGTHTDEQLLGRTASAAAQALGDALVLVERTLLAEMVAAEHLQVEPNGAGRTPGLRVVDDAGTPIGEHAAAFDSTAAAEALREVLLTWIADERAVVVEHLLLRPKFPGDALYPACSDGACGCCGDEDPYSFRLTYVMPGWTAPYNTDMEMRRFAERTIQQETPAHLIVKTCWVGNDGYVADPCDPVVDELAALLEERWGAAEREQACTCAAAVLAAFRDAFELWYEDRTLQQHQADELRRALVDVLEPVDLRDLGCAAPIDDDLKAALLAVAVDRFQDIVLRGRQFERFEDVWCRWLAADARIDWTEERLLDTLTALLAEHVVGSATPDALCGCAADVLTAFGTAFADWRDAQLRAGKLLEEFAPFEPGPVQLCPGLAFEAGTADAARDLLLERYARFTEVSVLLRLVVDAVSRLRNTYPGGTLHDCDEGDDRNPIRLNLTALGSNVR